MKKVERTERRYSADVSLSHGRAHIAIPDKMTTEDVAMLHRLIDFFVALQTPTAGTEE